MTKAESSQRTTSDRLIDEAISDATDRLRELEDTLGKDFDPFGSACDDGDRACLAVLELADQLQAARLHAEKAEKRVESTLVRLALTVRMWTHEQSLHRIEVAHQSDAILDGIEIVQDAVARLRRVVALRPWWSVTRWLVQGVIDRLEASIGRPGREGRNDDVLARLRREERTA